jgi:hypothetical protein
VSVIAELSSSPTMPASTTAREVILDVGEGHPGGAGVLGDERDHPALPLGEVPLVPAKERLVAHDRRGDAAVLPSPGAGDHRHLPEGRAGNLIPPCAVSEQVLMIGEQREAVDASK